MGKLCIGIIFGGISPEHDISLQSARNIQRTIDRDRFKVVMIRVNKDGTWCREDVLSTVCFLNCIRSTVSYIFQYLKRKWNKDIVGCNVYDVVSSNFDGEYDIFSGIDIVFPIMHGVLGEDGSLQGLLRIRKIPFVGSGVLGSALSMDKDIAKRLLGSDGLLVAPSVTLSSVDDVLDMGFEYCVDILGLPLFVKPASQGSSIGVSKVVDSVSFYQAINLAFSVDHKVLVESVIIGRELECAVLGNYNPKVSVCGEVILRKGMFYTYENKYFSKSENVEIVIPAKIDNTVYEEIRYVVLRAFHVLQCCGMARVDVFLTSDSRIIINEVNTLPGFTTTSMYPKLWEATGLSCKQLLTTLIELALESYQMNKNFSL